MERRAAEMRYGGLLAWDVIPVMVPEGGRLVRRTRWGGRLQPVAARGLQTGAGRQIFY